jgi:hypothetical protein
VWSSADLKGRTISWVLQRTKTIFINMIRLQDLLLERLTYGITIVKRIAQSMGETVTEELGKGANGIAYATESGRVLKITADTAEVALATRLRVKRLYKHIVNVYDVRKLPESYNREWGGTASSYVIIQDLVEPLSDNHRRIWNETRWTYMDPKVSDTEFRQRVHELIAADYKIQPDNEFIQRIMPQRRGLMRDFSELRIDKTEAHGANMGWNRHGSLVHYDAWQYAHYTKVSADARERNKRYNNSPAINRTPYAKGLGPDVDV